MGVADTLLNEISKFQSKQISELGVLRMPILSPKLFGVTFDPNRAAAKTQYSITTGNVKNDLFRFVNNVRKEIEKLPVEEQGRKAEILSKLSYMEGYLKTQIWLKEQDMYRI